MGNCRFIRRKLKLSETHFFSCKQVSQCSSLLFFGAFSRLLLELLYVRA